MLILLPYRIIEKREDIMDLEYLAFYLTHSKQSINANNYGHRTCALKKLQKTCLSNKNECCPEESYLTLFV